MEGLRGQQRALEEWDLLSAVLHAPGVDVGSQDVGSRDLPSQDAADLRDLVFRAVGPDEFTDPARRRLYVALYELWEAGRPIVFRQVMTSFQSDPEIPGLLAGLATDDTLAERVACQIQHAERERAARERLREVVRMAGGGQTDGADPDDSYFGDEAAAADGVASEDEAIGEEEAAHEGGGGAGPGDDPRSEILEARRRSE